MDYLISFKPNKELCDLILKQNHIILTNSGLHSTLNFFKMKPEYEKELISLLLKIKFNPFHIKTQEFDDFSKDSLVLKLSPSNELLQLHKNIVSIVEDYACPEFNKFTKQYFGNNYQPHITISKSSLNFNRNSKELLNIEDTISKYNLLKKLNKKYENIRTFYSKE
jgi:2'-5' RNA ligase